MPRSSVVRVLSVLLIAPVVGCVEEADEPTLDALGEPLVGVARDVALARADVDVTLGLVARFEVRPGELLSIYEPTPGTIVLASGGAPDGADEHTDRSLAGVWARATDDAEMPAKLAALARALGDRPVPGAPHLAGEAGRAPPRPGQPDAAVAGFCDTAFYKYDMADCLLNANYDTDFKLCVDNRLDFLAGKAEKAYHTTAVVCPNRGAVRLHLTLANGYGDVVVPQHNYEQWSVTHLNCVDPEYAQYCGWTSFSVLDAGGDRFHFRMLADQQ